MSLKNPRPSHHPPHILAQVVMLTARSLTTIFRQPEAWFASFCISMFFYLVNEASVGRVIKFMPGGEHIDAIGVILSMSVVSICFHSPAGMEILRDCTKGYFDKVLLTPASRLALFLGPIIAGSICMTLQFVVFVLLSLYLGLTPALGFWSILIVFGFALALNIGFAAFVVGIALRTNSEAATQAAGMLFFPLTFLTNAYFRMEDLALWLRIAARINPVTYILQAIRSVILNGWETEVLLTGVGVCVLLCFLAFLFAFRSLSARASYK